MVLSFNMIIKLGDWLINKQASCFFDLFFFNCCKLEKCINYTFSYGLYIKTDACKDQNTVNCNVTITHKDSKLVWKGHLENHIAPDNHIYNHFSEEFKSVIILGFKRFLRCNVNPVEFGKNCYKSNLEIWIMLEDSEHDYH